MTNFSFIRYDSHVLSYIAEVYDENKRYDVRCIIHGYNDVTVAKAFAVNVLFGIGLVYVCGIPVQAMQLHIPFLKSLQLSFVYLPGDCIKAVVAAYLITKVRKAVAVPGRSKTASM
ncbi:biotin transporter BioY [Priestia megaterium]|uniref:biotin transporter BioY n=1 Tax=Priestia megaterium TaxID=1404 RepID=UPI0035BE6AE1